MGWSEASYWADIRDLAGIAIKEAAGRDLDEVINDLVNGSDWVVYPMGAEATMAYTENADALIDEIGAEAIARFRSWIGAAECFAAHAMCADIRDEIDALGLDTEEVHENT